MKLSVQAQCARAWLAMSCVIAMGACALESAEQGHAEGVELVAAELTKASKPDVGRVVLCHVTEEGKRHTLTVAAPAVSAHLGHGDVVGECSAGCASAAECDDGNACTAESCGANGACSHVAVECDDGNPCTQESCDSVSGCVTAPITGVACDDGNECTAVDACSAGACRGTAIAGCCRTDEDCADDDGCTQDVCASGSCQNVAIGCAVADLCVAGFCDPITGACSSVPVSCDDEDSCTSDSCSPAMGCQHAAIECSEDPPSCIPSASSDEPDAAFVDDNCDGIDGDLSSAVLVAPWGDDDDCGLSLTTPCATVAAAIARALSLGRTDVYLQAGRYTETIVLASGIRLFGGYDSAWQRRPRTEAGHEVILRSEETGEVVTVHAQNLAQAATLADLVIEGPDVQQDAGARGLSSYGVRAESSQLSLIRVLIKGGSGARGRAGAAGTGASSTSAMSGGAGQSAVQFQTTCDASSRGAGGAGATNTCGGSTSVFGSAGGAGGTMDTLCVASGFGSDFAATRGLDGSATAALGGGAGGEACAAGGAGAFGSAGANGAGGASAASTRGFLQNGYWFAFEGRAGSAGAHGMGGSGGGGSGGCDVGVDSYGAGGGGGGAGGCGALQGGGGGQGGGGSIGILAIASDVLLDQCVIQPSVAAAGGAGGQGAAGQLGGIGGAGGTGAGGSLAGGSGGSGGRGGHSGGGAGGNAGAAVGVLSYDATITDNGSTFVLPNAAAGGLGGSVPLGGSAGQAGLDGMVEEILVCASTSGC